MFEREVGINDLVAEDPFLVFGLSFNGLCLCVRFVSRLYISGVCDFDVLNY